MKTRATIRFKLPSIRHAETVLTSLAPEISRPGFGRSKVDLRRDAAFLVLEVEADDTIALRSTLNAYLRWINSTVNVVQTIEQT